MKKIIIMGAGGYGKIVADVCRQFEYEEIIFLDDNSADAVGKLEEYGEYADYDIYPAFRNNELRLKWVRKLSNCGAMIDHGCVIEEGCHICLGAIVKGENRISKLTKIEAGEVVAARKYKVVS